MSPRIIRNFLMVCLLLLVAGTSDAARVRVIHRRGVTRVRVTTSAGFPIRRALPEVIVRPGPVIRVVPRVYLAPVAFTAVAVATVPPPAHRLWTSAETLTRDDGWTDFTLNVDRRGERLLLDIDHGTAQVSFAEIVFENGETQVVDFNDRAQARGAYELLDVHGRAVDHVRVVARADTDESVIRVHLI